MNTFISIMLIIILVLIISDVFFLWRIFKNIGKKKKNLPDEKYFELKYNINLLKAVSGILIFLVGFLGFNSYNNISENIDKDFSEKFERQNRRIDSLTLKLFNYESLVDSLKIEEGEAVKNINDINRKFISIDNKLNLNQEALKYTTKVFVINDLKYPGGATTERDKAFTIFFKDLKTNYNEGLPKFKSSPMVILQGKGIILDVAEITEDYVRINAMDTFPYENDNNNFYYFDMWIAEPN